METLKQIDKKIQDKQKEFSESAKQCDFCGSYHGDLKEKIDGLISERETLKEVLEILEARKGFCNEYEYVVDDIISEIKG